ncbi:MAG: two-component regulator propeller domain-containing protein [Rhodothermales bacterium]
MTLVCALGMLLYTPVCAQHATRFDRMGTTDGLSSLAITALEQDEQGFLWVGTFDGLNRYDGRSFTHFPAGDAYLTDNAIQPGALLARGGSLWIGTRNGLNRLDLTTGEVDHYLEMPGDSSVFGRGIINALAITEDGALWVATWRGLYRFDRLTNTYTEVDTQLDDVSGFSALGVDGQDGLYVGTQRGLAYRPPGEAGFRPIQTGTPADSLIIKSLLVDEKGTLWIGLVGGGVVQWHPETREALAVRAGRRIVGNSTEANVYAIEQDGQGRIWVGIWGYGLCVYGGAPGNWDCATEEETDASSLSSDDVTSLLVDRSGHLFVGTWNGLNKRRSPKAFEVLWPRATREAGMLSHPRVNAIHEDRNGYLWVGYLGGGLDRLDRSAGTVRRFVSEPADPGSLSFDQIWSITEDRDGNIWVATGGGGISRYDPSRDRFSRYVPGPASGTLPDALIYSVYEDVSGTLWTGTVTSGMARYDASTDSFIHYPYAGGATTGPAHFSVWPMLEDQAGRFWVGTVGGGLERLDRTHGIFSRVPSVTDMPLRTSRMKIVSLAETPDGAIWAATTGDGLMRIDPETDALRLFTVADSLPHNTVMCVLPGMGNDIWASTADGLARIDGDRQQVAAIYTASDGLPTASFLDGACHRSRRGELFFGTNEGLVAFLPDSIRNNPTPPLMALTGFDLFGQPYPLPRSIAYTSSVRLDHDQNEFTVHFAALEFDTPADNRYAYRLDGVDAHWVYSSNPVARYPNLSPGEYTFRVIGANNDGVWSEHEARLAVVIVPAWYQRWWVQVLLLLGAGLGVGLFFAYRASMKLRLEQTERRAQAERETARRNMVRELHDDIGSDLNGLVFSLERLGRSDRFSVEDRRVLLELWGRARDMFDYVRDVTWVVESNNDTLPGLIDRLHQVVFVFFPSGKAAFHAPDTVPPIALEMEKRQHIYMIAKEAMHNAMKHADAGRVDVAVAYEAGVLTVTVADDGSGFDTDVQRAGYGMGHMDDRTRAIGGTLKVESAPGAGTRIELSVSIT